MKALIITSLILSSVAYASEEEAAGKAVAEALVVSTGVDKMIEKTVTNMVNPEYREPVARTLTVIDAISKQKVTFTWTF